MMPYTLMSYSLYWSVHDLREHTIGCSIVNGPHAVVNTRQRAAACIQKQGHRLLPVREDGYLQGRVAGDVLYVGVSGGVSRVGE